MKQRAQMLRGWRRRLTGDGDGETPPIIGVFWATIWLFWLLSPLWDALHRLDEPQGWWGVFSIVAFAVVYTWHWMTRWTVFGGDADKWLNTLDAASLGRYAALAVLSVVAMVSIGQDGATALIFVAVSAMWTFSVRVGLTIGVAIGGLYIWLSIQVPGWTFDSGGLIGLSFALIAVLAGRTAGGRQRQLQASRRENARLAVDEERNRMARDLHDILGHSLTVITVKAELAGRLIDVDLERARAEIADLERLSRDALADVRRTVTGFREVTLTGELARAREALRAAGITAELPATVDTVDADLRETFAWAVREGVTNVIRHSHASSCTIEVGPTTLRVRDDGVGTRDSAAGNGLFGLRERARAVGAQVITESCSPQGFSLAVSATAVADIATAAAPTSDAELPPPALKAGRA